MQRDLSDTGIGMITIGFRPPQPLHDLADYLHLTGPMVSDEQRTVYRLLGLRRAPLRRVYSPGTLAFYTRARRRGQQLQRPVEDTRQLGGDAIIADGVVTRRWAPRSPDDRVTPARLVAAARTAARL
ncbi:AhpC/TSA family protein [Pseudonocardia nigra]|uniref:AhpC/TSA family protein n=1 Tax=Pseudonocardia nigra TaxID=1921578 RepID=UPI001C5DEA02|nr:AhpC/TSA family protein [Pseudonocardia nigra]